MRGCIYKFIELEAGSYSSRTNNHTDSLPVRSSPLLNFVERIVLLQALSSLGKKYVAVYFIHAKAQMSYGLAWKPFRGKNAELGEDRLSAILATPEI